MLRSTLSRRSARAYLNEVAGANPDLATELESLLAAHEKAGAGFLNVPAAKAIAQLEVRGPSEILAGKRMGLTRSLRRGARL